MTTRSRRPASRQGAPAAALLGKNAATARTQSIVVQPAVPPPVVVEHDPAPPTPATEPDPLAGVQLPPLPTEPPPLPPGVKEGFDDLPEGATAAKPLEATVEAMVEGVGDEVPVDPTTGKPAEIPLDPTTGKPIVHGGYDPELARALEEGQAAARAGAGRGKANLTDPEEHRALQAKHRLVAQSIRAQAAREEAVSLEERDRLAAEVTDLELETFEEREVRLKAEAKAEYERRVEAMDPNEPRYVVGYRPPRPKVAGYVLEIGDVVPGAASFARLESWLSAGILKREGA